MLLIVIALIYLFLGRVGLHLQTYLGLGDLIVIDGIAAFAGAVCIGFF